MASKPVDLYTHSFAEILKVYIDTFAGFSYVPGPGSPHSMFLSQGCILREASGIREGKQNTLSKDRKGSEEPPVAYASSWVNRQSHLDDLQQVGFYSQGAE